MHQLESFLVLLAADKVDLELGLPSSQSVRQQSLFPKIGFEKCCGDWRGMSLVHAVLFSLVEPMPVANPSPSYQANELQRRLG